MGGQRQQILLWPQKIDAKKRDLSYGPLEFLGARGGRSSSGPPKIAVNKRDLSYGPLIL